MITSFETTEKINSRNFFFSKINLNKQLITLGGPSLSCAFHYLSLGGKNVISIEKDSRVYKIQKSLITNEPIKLFFCDAINWFNTNKCDDCNVFLDTFSPIGKPLLNNIHSMFKSIISSADIGIVFLARREKYLKDMILNDRTIIFKKIIKEIASLTKIEVSNIQIHSYGGIRNAPMRLITFNCNKINNSLNTAFKTIKVHDNITSKIIKF